MPRQHSLIVLQGQLIVALAARNAGLESRNPELEARAAGLEERLARLARAVSRNSRHVNMLIRALIIAGHSAGAAMRRASCSVYETRPVSGKRSRCTGEPHVPRSLTVTF